MSKQQSDWSGNSKAIYSTLGASNHSNDEREINDYYAKLYDFPADERLFSQSAKALQELMKRHIRKANVKKIRVHDLRHSHCAYLINQGVQPLIIKERLGHKDIKVTLNTYGHLYPSEQKKVASLLDNLRGNGGDASCK